MAAVRSTTWASAKTKQEEKMKFLCSKLGNCCRLHMDELRWNRVRQGCRKTSTDSDPSTPRRPDPGLDPLLKDTKVTDIDLNDVFGDPAKEIEGQEVVVFGDVQLDFEERALLAKRPEYALYDSLDYNKIQEEMNVAMVKVRWDRRSREEHDEDDSDTGGGGGNTVSDDETIRIEEAQARMVFDKSTNSVDMGARRATDMAHNKRLHIPQPRPAVEEAMLGARLEMWKQATSSYIKDNCSEGGTQATHNLTATERIGLSKLKKRIKAGEIIVIKSDKGNRFTVSSIESYERQGDQHTAADRKVSEEELRRIQARMNVLARSLGKVMGLGTNGGDRNAAICWGNLSTEACISPLLYPSPKTHKDIDDQGDPKTRPIVQANSCVTSRPGEVLADLLEAALMAYPEQAECRSTEEILAKIDAENMTVKEMGVNVVVGSGDVVGLYPSLRHHESARMCGKMVLDSPATFKNVDLKTAGVFVATNCSTQEIKEAGLSTVIPLRKHVKGNHPTPSTPELSTCGGENEVPSKFWPMRTDVSERESRILFSKVIEVGVRMVMRNHTYRWKGEMWLQSQGVPTGLKLSGIVGRICKHGRVEGLDGEADVNFNWSQIGRL